MGEKIGGECRSDVTLRVCWRFHSRLAALRLGASAILPESGLLHGSACYLIACTQVAAILCISEQLGERVVEFLIGGCVEDFSLRDFYCDILLCSVGGEQLILWLSDWLLKRCV